MEFGKAPVIVMDIAATLPKSGSTTWADEVEAEEAEFGQGMILIDLCHGCMQSTLRLAGIRLRRQTLQRGAMSIAWGNGTLHRALYSCIIFMIILNDDRAMSAPAGCVQTTEEVLVLQLLFPLIARYIMIDTSQCHQYMGELQSQLKLQRNGRKFLINRPIGLSLAMWHMI